MPRTRVANLVGTISGTAINVGSISLSSGLNIDSQINSAYGQANLAYAQANTANNNSQQAYDQATFARDQANNARSQANTARDTANGAYAQANGAYTHANIVYAQANTARDQANTARNTANDAYGQANTATTNAGNAYSAANTAQTNALNAYGQANTATTNAGNAYAQANTANNNSQQAYDQATFARDQANTARLQANTARDQANTSRDQANTARTTANDAYAQANTANNNSQQAYDQATFARDQANTARLQANTARTTANDAYNSANLAYSQANSARSDANTTFVTINTTFGTLNTNITNLNSGVGTINSHLGTINTTFGTVNTTFGTTNTTFGTLNTNITTANTQANNARDQANSARDQANTARTTANDAYGQANTSRSDANTTFATINTTFSTYNTTFATLNTSAGSQNTAITNAHDQANAARLQANTARDTANNAYATANLKLNTSGGSISGDLSITGNLTVQGNATTLNISNLSVNDSIILMANGQVGDSTDIGFIGHFDRGATATHAGLIRKATENRFYLFDNYEVEPTNNVIDVNGQNFRVGNIRLGIINANSFVTSAGLDVTGQANSAFGQANAARSDANTTFGTINTTFATFNTTFGTTNTTFGTINTTFGTHNTWINNLNTATGTINSHLGTINTTFGTTNTTFGTLNTNITNLNSGLGTINSHLGTINTTFGTVNTTFGTINTTFGTLNTNISGANTYASGLANAAANTVAVYANDALVLAKANVNFNNSSTVNVSVTANSTTGRSNVGFTANSTALGIPTINAHLGTINTTFGTTNTTFGTINTTFGTTNTTFGTVNTNYQAAYAQANTAGTNALNAYGQANAARDQANTSRSDANTTFATINTTFATLNTSAGTQNTATTTANDQANTARGQANTARDQANTAYGQANTATTNAGNAYGQANTATTNAGNAYNTANNRVATVSGTSGRITSSGTTGITLDLATAGAGAASYSSGISALSVDAYGRVTSVTGSAGYLTSLSFDGLTNKTSGTGTYTTSGVFTASNFSDATGTYNVNLGSGGSEGRGLVAGYSGGSYGGIGYNVRHTPTGATWIAPGGDTSTYLLFTGGGFAFYGAGAGSAGRTLSYTTLATLSVSGAFNTAGAITQASNQVLHAGNYTSYSPSLTGTGASGTWAISITGNAATLGGLSLQTSGSAIGANQIARSDGNGYSFFNYINSNTGNSENPTISQIIVTNGSDNYYRKASGAHLISQLGLATSFDSLSSKASGTGTYTTSGDFRAPIFYDSNNTAYYADPASTSVFNQINLAGILRRTSSAAGYLDGNYSGAETGSTSGAIYTIGGGSYQPGTTSLGNMYGVGYTVGNGTSNPGLGSTGWGFYVASAGTSRIFLDSDNGIGRATGDWRAPIFYDSNNTGYYLDPASTTSIRTVGSWRSDSSSWDGEFSGKIQYHSNHWYIQAADSFIYRNSSGSNVFTVNQSGNAIASADFRAPIFYDNNNTAFYTDPASTSVLNGVRAVGGLGTESIGSTSPNSVARIQFPGGSAFSSDGSTGAIKIRLPFRNNNAMWALKIRIYNYSTNTIGEYHVGAYSYNNGGYNAAASYQGSANYSARTVRFGNDGTYDCIWIGETSSSWSYPVVSVTDVMGGFRSGTFANFASGWDVSVVGSFGTVETTITPSILSTNITSESAFYTPIFYDSNNTGYYSDPASTSRLNVIYCGDVYNDLGGWFRNYGATGIYNQSYDNHFYSASSGYWTSATDNGMIFRNAYEGTLQGYVYFDGNGFGLLHSGGGWAVRTTTSLVEIYNRLDAPIMYDSNNTAFYIDANSSGIAANLNGRVVSRNTLGTINNGGSKTLAVGESYVVTSGGQTITLPASPSGGDCVSISVGNFTNTTVARNGQNIMALAEDMTIDTAYAGFTLRFHDATYGWRII